MYSQRVELIKTKNAIHLISKGKGLLVEQDKNNKNGKTECTKRNIYMFGDINEALFKDVMEKLLTFNVESIEEPIHIYINTYGGYIDDMFALYDLMQASSATICTYGVGKVMSAGSLILVAGDVRHITPNCRIMIHPINAIAYGTPYQISIESNEIERMQKQYIKLMCQHTKLVNKKFEAILKQNRDIYFTAQEAIKNGLVDNILLGFRERKHAKIKKGKKNNDKKN